RVQELEDAGLDGCFGEQLLLAVRRGRLRQERARKRAIDRAREIAVAPRGLGARELRPTSAGSLVEIGAPARGGRFWGLQVLRVEPLDEPDVDAEIKRHRSTANPACSSVMPDLLLPRPPAAVTLCSGLRFSAMRCVVSIAPSRRNSAPRPVLPS